MKYTTKPFILILFLVFTSSLSFSQTWIWAKQGLYKDTASWGDVASITIDSSGNIFETGGFSGRVTFGSNIVTTVQKGIHGNVFLAKYDTNGNVVWVDSANA